MTERTFINKIRSSFSETNQVEEPCIEHYTRIIGILLGLLSFLLYYA